ncbi:MAG: EscN/YscN/HrcN family type III secretion system ATPase [Deltaproteobacteria bacterium]|nr:EscN/YscN/HrcN family type III secretion system ATPase [Deltaproteobacteria bacterium]MBN2670626.1 EscN/YscN/HrcN family type III secretion system ATPase [Deltaproteobacteria bacterium]
MTTRDPIAQLTDRLEHICTPQITGKITCIRETVIEGVLAGAATHAIVQIETNAQRTIAEITQVNGADVTLMPLSPAPIVTVGDTITLLHRAAVVDVGSRLLGRVINPMGDPMDDLGPIRETIPWPLHRNAPHPLQRPAIETPLATGVKVIDGLLAFGWGARFGLFAGPGQGKSTLLGNLAAHADCDVVVICLAGERGREAGEFVHRILGKTGRSRSVVVLSTSDMPAAQRVMSLQTSTAIAEWFRDQGNRVLLLVDSLTRIVRAKRDMDVAAGIPMGPSRLSATTLNFLPPLLERAAPNRFGSISAMYTVLEQTTDDQMMSGEITSLLDGHILLSKKRADAGKWPAVNVVESVSRVMNQVMLAEDREAASQLRRVLAAWDENEELLLIGAYQNGSCRYTDMYLRLKNEIEAFLTQGNAPVPLDATRRQLRQLTSLFH